MINQLKNILLVDDDSATIFLTTWTIKKLGFEGDVLTAKNGQEALNYFTSATTNHSPHLILLDIHMPIMNGWEFIEKYQLLKHRHQKDVLILMISDEERDQEQLANIQCDFPVSTIKKPLKKEYLMAILEERLK